MRKELKGVQNAVAGDWFYWFFVPYTVLTLAAFAYLAFDFVTHPLAPDAMYGSILFRLFVGLGVAPFGLIVSVLVLRRTHHNVTALFLFMCTAVAMLGTLRLDSPLPEEIFNFVYLGLWLLPLYFPDGQPAPRRFRRWLRAYSVISTVFFIGIILFHPTLAVTRLQQVTEGIPNPLFIPALLPYQEAAGIIQSILWIGSVLLIIPSLALRYRENTNVVRQQIKWFVWIFGIFIILYVAFFVSGLYDDPQRYGLPGKVVEFILLLSFLVAPFLAVGLSILRYRLYDIDIVIRRTLVYATLTAILAAIYFGGVVLAQQAIRALTGQASDGAIVISTLAVAALFSPLRRRIQEIIDQRLYRRKYDAGQALAQFAATARDEVDLTQLSTALVTVVEDTLRPTRVSLWLSDPKLK